ncbi:hypothetical protein MSG28_002488 [Choristoneura fumiferana]|uniref:Uncharacterized protein n=1 Tax=Choristoneura fumiferana TaxID=7141 RepID=A0ACC0JWJ0_CHOFU|nr:hypothetical protein MSG28_002488 [Choristoneura fumiferana]
MWGKPPQWLSGRKRKHKHFGLNTYHIHQCQRGCRRDRGDDMSAGALRADARADSTPGSDAASRACSPSAGPGACISTTGPCINVASEQQTPRHRCPPLPAQEHQHDTGEQQSPHYHCSALPAQELASTRQVSSRLHATAVLYCRLRIMHQRDTGACINAASEQQTPRHRCPLLPAQENASTRHRLHATAVLHCGSGECINATQVSNSLQHHWFCTTGPGACINVASEQQTPRHRCPLLPAQEHQHDRLNSGLEGRELNINNASSDEERDSQLVILNSKGGAYKLRDSRIIEIAGGRELYSQSRTKAVRKLRHNNTHKHNLRNKVRSLGKDTIEYSDNHSNEINLHRINNEPKKMISRHTSPTYTNGDRDTREGTMGIPKNSSPILDPHKTNDVSTKSSPIAVVADGEVVVFDDNEDWKGLRTDPDASDNEIDLSVKRTLDNMKNGDSDLMNNKSEVSESESSPGEERSDASPSGVWMSGDEDKGRFTRVIGELPIAEYEGSPRRYGIGSQKAQPVRSPRPGFPQRIVTESRDVTPPSGSAAFDYLYEFSETRKVLEEFFRCPAVAAHTQLNSHDEIVNFQELDYELRRQTQDCPSENGVEGSDAEWPHADTLDSPHTAHNHTNFLGLQRGGVMSYSMWPLCGLAEVWPLRVKCVFILTTTRVLPRAERSGAKRRRGLERLGLPRRAPPRRAPLALSPDTSEGSDLSLIIMENELSEMKVQMDTSRVVVTHLPIVEDGLSSGHASDNDNNNQLPTLQTHSSVIIEEIVENGTSTEAHVLSDADLHSLDPLGTVFPILIVDMIFSPPF